MFNQNQELQKLINIALDKEMYPEVLKYLYGALKEDIVSNRELRRSLSLNENCPVEILEKLIKDEIPEIRANAARHKDATAKMIASCVKDDVKEVRLEAVKNPVITEDTLWQFVKDDDEDVVKLARSVLKARL